MPRRRKRREPARSEQPRAFHAPFRELAGEVRRSLPRARRPAAAPAARPRRDPAAAAPARPEPEQDQDSFLREMANVRPLTADARVDAPAPAQRVVRVPVDEEGEALATLQDLVAGDGTFDVSDSTEYVEGAIVGLDPRVVRRLRRGEFAYQASLDLHGLTAAAAEAEVTAFIARAQAVGHRAVLIVHGRGRNSRAQVPVLKERLKRWLARGGNARRVLAFTSARPADGGTGAVYVLLRRRRGVREPIAVWEGAKRE